VTRICNEISLLCNTHTTRQFDYHIQTDASGSWGCGVYFNGRWFQLPWSLDWAPIGIMANELAPKLVQNTVKTRSPFYSSILEAAKKGSSKDPTAMYLLCCLWFLTATFGIDITVSHTEPLTRPSVQEPTCLIPYAPPSGIIHTNIHTTTLFSTHLHQETRWTSSLFQRNLNKLTTLYNK